MEAPEDDIITVGRSRAVPGSQASFLELYTADAARGAVAPLADYLERFPAERMEVARDYLRLQGGEALERRLSESTGRASGVEHTEDGAIEKIGPYRLLRELGRGAQGVVFLAVDERIDRLVALKTLAPGITTSSEMRSRFRREAAIVAKVEHPAICPIYEADFVDDVGYIAMRYVDGPPLAKRIAAAERPGDVRESCAIVEKLARALHVAHEVGIIHRDVKPGNVMMTRDDEPLLVDFGLARDDSVDAVRTESGVEIGTPAYMSPEQVARLGSRVDRRTDIWSLGATLYELLTLQRPFSGTTRAELYHAIEFKAPRDPRTLNRAISKDLAVILETVLAKNPNHRYQTAAAFAADLERLRTGFPIAARKIGPVRALWRWSKRRPAVASLCFTLILALPTIAALLTREITTADERRRAHELAVEEERDQILAEAFYAINEGDPDDALPILARAMAMEGQSPEAAAGVVMAHAAKRRWTEARAALERSRPLLLGTSIGELLGAKVGAEGRDGATTMPSEPAEPEMAIEHFIVGQELVTRTKKLRAAAERATSSEWATRADRAAGADLAALSRKALHHATQAILLSRQPRFAYYALRAQAAGLLKDKDAGTETAHALESHWPNLARAHFWAGYSLAEGPESEAALKRGLAIDPRDCLSLLNLAFNLGNRRRVDESIDAFRRCLAINPRYYEAHHYLGIALRGSGRLDEAVASLAKAAALDPTRSEAPHWIAKTLVDLGRDDEAIVQYRTALAADPENAVAWSGLCIALRRLGRFVEAEDAARKALALDATSGPYHVNLGRVFLARGRLGDAEQAFRRAIGLDAQLANAHLGLGEVSCKLRRFDEAIDECLLAVAIEPTNAAAYAMLAMSYQASSKFEAAVVAGRQAITLEPGNELFMAHLGSSLFSAGRFDEAIAACRRSVAIRPGFAAYHLMASVLFAQSEYAAAADAYRRSIELTPDAHSFLNLGKTLEKLDLYAEALEEYRKALKTEPSLGVARSAAAAVEARLKRDHELATAMASDGEPEAAPELLAWSSYARRHGRPLAAARWAQAAFDADDDCFGDVEDEKAMNAARAAVRAAQGDGDARELAESDRRAWRSRALEWLREALDEWRRLAANRKEALNPMNRWSLCASLNRWRNERDFDAVRASERLAALGDKERAAWTKLWSEVETLYADSKPTFADEREWIERLTRPHEAESRPRSKAPND